MGALRCVDRDRFRCHHSNHGPYRARDRGAARLRGVELGVFHTLCLHDPARDRSVVPGIVAALDVLVVAVFILRSFAMFGSFLGTWLPFVLIFAATWATGIAVGRPHGMARP